MCSERSLDLRIAPFAGLPGPLRWTARVLAVLVVLALLLAGAAVWTVRRSFPQTAGELRLPGLQAKATVLRDGHGVPHIYADTPHDLFLAQGYVHAQDRFWEMDFRRKTTAGRLSELFGAATLDVDKVVRTLGWRRTAERELPLLSAATRQALTDYTAGVNAWMTAHAGFAERSLEYVVLGLTNSSYTPEPWTPADSLAWLKAMAWDLRSNMDDELQRALYASVLPPDRVAQLFPAYPFDRHAPIVTGTGERDGGGATAVRPAAQDRAGVPGTAAALAAVARTLRAMPSPLGTPGSDREGIGSNSWVVSGAHTATGKPLLANDPHLGPRIPSLWYQAGLHCRVRSAACPYDVVGYTFSGLPGVVIGHNDRVAWGFTNLAPDVSDLYLERTKGDTYQAGGGFRPMEVRTEEIKVAGRAPEKLVVRATRHGPIVSGVLESAAEAVPGAAAAAGESGDGLEVALRWTALDPGRTGDALLLLNTARNFEEFRAAAASFEVPAQNMVYADVDGNIGYQAPGRIPIRSRGDGTWPAKGWTGEAEWTGFIPFDELPTAYNPPEGYIVTANNAATGPGYDHFLTADWAYGHRSERIGQRLRQAIAGGKMTAATMGDIQMDSANTFAPTLVPHLLRAGVPDGGEIQKLLGAWDFSQGRDSAAAAYFNAVWRHLLRRTFDDELPESGRPGGGDRWYEVVRTLLDRPADPFWDDVRTKGRTETREDTLRAAMADARAELRERLGDRPGEWRWGDLHTLELTNESFGTSGIGPVEWLFNRGPLRLAGGKDSVDATGWNAAEGYEVDWVPSMRMVVDLADLDRSRWVNLTGASGHAFHAAYADQAELWADGATTPMRQTERAVRADTVDTLTLVP
ncbi:penicillin acylase family protein [Sphaerisporangium sp. B11E5]|uniref:penicillin acylase family protein n=1 Tax=Sphaerisporangium sp. B11E5 TaxID=3153563 RepID=UPI00325D4375